MIAVAYCTLGSRSGHEAGRWLLEKLYLQETGEALPMITVTERGKPYFPESRYHFSISHTTGHAFCALASYPIGIDAEETDRHVPPRLIEKILSPAELNRVKQCDDINAAVLKLWVLKEAAAKLTGEGLQGFPNQTDYSPDDSRIRILDGCYIALLSDHSSEGAVFYAF